MKLFENNNFLILKDDGHFIFYNSIRHYVCRISELDLTIFNLIYIHKDINKIISKIDNKYHNYVKSVYDAVLHNSVMSEEPIETDRTSNKIPPKSYYVHLTYKCNLACTYCYNKRFRTNFIEMPTPKWDNIIDKIIPYAEHIVITGGEPTLTPLLPHIIRRIKHKKPNVHIEMISNCMTDFERYPYSDFVFNNIDSVVFSCDNLTDVGQTRINFKPHLFKQNVMYLHKKYKKLSITISSVYSKCNEHEICLIKNYCKEQTVNFRNVLIVPNNKSELSLLPTVEKYKATFSQTAKEMPPLRLYCGAGLGLISIDPLGNVYPCQSLHYKKYKMGNLNNTTIDDIINSKVYHNIFLNYSVDNISVCKDCNVRYICGAGCRAATANLEQDPTAFPRTLCEYYKEKAINTLRSIPYPNDK